jgi:signal transduction histidine kinase
MNKRLKILILEDVENDVGLVAHVLKKSGFQFELKRVDTQLEYTEAIQHYDPDVILSDHSLPQFNSIEALAIYKESKLNVPFILVTGSVSEEFAVTCLMQGADDYILKSNLLRLPRAIENALLRREQGRRQKESDAMLRSQYDALVKANQELDNFVYSLSHSIRSPLASIMGLVNLVQRENKNQGEMFSGYLGMMERSAKKLDETIAEIMEYSRNARSEIQNVEINVRSVIEESLERLKYMSGADRVVPTINISQHHPFYSDPYRLEMIFSNLFANSIQYRNEGNESCTLEVDVQILDNVAKIRIADNGVGIAPEQLPRVFEMFYRGTTMSDGAGLGLYIAREAINKLEGQIKIESGLGVGTVCDIQLRANYG